MSKSQRQFSAWEINHLRRYGFDPDQVATEFPASVPVEYITGMAQFGGLELTVNHDVLIPRLETEQLVELALEFIKRREPDDLKIIDVGTGSGAIGIGIILGLTDPERLSVTLADISPVALRVATQNVFSLIPIDLLSQVSIVQSSLLKSVTGDFDLIIANLPYIPSSRISQLAESIKDHEPLLALDGGDDGLSLIRELLGEAKSRLSPGGLVLLEVDDTHLDPREFKEWQIEVKRDYADKVRFWVAKLQP